MIRRVRTDIDFHSHGTRCSAWHFRADGDGATTPAGRPCVVMGHGLGATKDAGLEPFAERFATAGWDVLVFDYRGFGTSDVAPGRPRQDVDHRRHREDYHAALAAARAIDGVDPERVVLWGSSYSGGHVVPVAVADGRVAGVISQGAAMDGLRAVALILSYAGPVALLRLTGHALLDLAGSMLRRPPRLIPIVGPPGSLAAITAEGAETGYTHIMGPTFRNEMCARGILPIMLNRPVTSAGRLDVPILLVKAEGDNVAPPAAVEVVGRRARRSRMVRLDVGHFDIYVGEPFETSVTEQVAFLGSL